MVAEDYLSFLNELVQKQNDSSVIVKIRKPPSYILNFLPHLKDTDIVLIYKEISTKNGFVHVVRRNDSAGEISDGDVTGNPLENPFLEDDSFNITGTFLETSPDDEAMVHFPLPLLKARRIISDCNVERKVPIPVWVLTDGTDFYKTTLLSSDTRDGWIRRSYAKNNGCILDIPPLESLLAIHKKHIFKKNTVTKCKVSGLFSKHRTYCAEDGTKIYSSTEVKLTWDHLVKDPPLHSKSVQINIVTRCRVGCSHARDGVYFFWNELLLLHNVLNIIKSNDRINYSVVIKPYISVLQNLRVEPKTPQTNIKHIILTDYFDFEVNRKENPTLVSIIDSFMSLKRIGLDATDKLWYMFMECSSIEEIFSCIKEVFELKQTYTPFVTSDNISGLAPRLSGENVPDILDPLECFVEVGIEKLKKEIFLIFSEIGASNYLNMPNFPNFSKIKSANWMSTVETWIKWLSQIFCVLEILSNNETAVSLKSENISMFASSILDYFTSIKSGISGVEWLLQNRQQEFTWATKPQIIENLISRSPEQWMLRLESGTERQTIESVFLKSSSYAFPTTTLTDCTMKSSYWAELHTISDKL